MDSIADLDIYYRNIVLNFEHSLLIARRISPQPSWQLIDVLVKGLFRLRLWGKHIKVESGTLKAVNSDETWRFILQRHMRNIELVWKKIVTLILADDQNNDLSLK